MTNPFPSSPPEEANTSAVWPLLWISAAAAAICYLVLFAMSKYYALNVEQVDRPMIAIIAIYAAAFVPCWLATWGAARLPNSRQLFWWILGTSALFRLLLLPTPPFQEIDIYRYLWDGAVVAQGESPYRYTQNEVKQAVQTIRNGFSVDDAQLAHLAQMAIDSPGLENVLNTVHYSELPSPYPPVSQAVFAAPALVTPSNWTGDARLKLLKTILTGFDLATLLVVIALLRRAGLPIGLAIAYGWCPLVMKETANSGHLDSITIFFATSALWVGWIGLSATRSAVAIRGLAGSAILLALGVAAKLYPVVLAPLLFFAWGRRVGWASAVVWALLFMSVTGATMAPMIALSSSSTAEAEADVGTALPPPPDLAQEQDVVVTRTAPTAGIKAFLERWEMNDLLFMIAVENLRPNDHYPAYQKPWFTFLSDDTAGKITGWWQKVIDPLGTHEDVGSASFKLARLITALAFIAIAVVLAWRATPFRHATVTDNTPSESGAPGTMTAYAAPWLRAGFLTLAWFWLLAPTQNPWYWCWAVPLLPFARLRAWHVLGALSLLYYTRFWLSVHYPEAGVFGTPYNGEYFFFFVIAWIEFGPWLIALAVESLLRRSARHPEERKLA